MKHLLIILFMAYSINAISQNPNEPSIGYLGNGGLRIQNIKNKKSIVKGEYYYNENWNVGTIELFSGELIKDFPLKYDMKTNQVDIKVDSEIKTLSTRMIKEIVWNNNIGQKEILRNSIIYDKNLQGFFSVINDEHTPLLKKTYLKLQEANYNPALDVGDKSDKYLKISKYYTTINGEIKEIKNKKKKILKLFKNKKNEVKKYANDNNLSYKKDNDLAKIFEYYNSL